MSNVIPLFARPACTASNAPPPAKPKRNVRRKAVLTLAPTKHCGKASLSHGKGHYLGKLTCGDWSIELDDGGSLGMIAWVLGIGTVQLSTPSFPGQTFRLLASAAQIPHELRPLAESFTNKQRQEYWFYEGFFTKLSMAWASAKQVRELVDRWEQETLPAALAAVPVELQVNTRLSRGVYDDRGWPLTKSQIASEAQYKRMMSNVAKALAGDPTVSGMPVIPWNLVSRVKDPHGPIALNGEAYTAVQRIFYAVGFPRMPMTWAELGRGYFFASQVTSPKSARFLPDYEGWCKAARSVFEKYNLRHLALYDAAMAEDKVEMMRLHKDTDWLAQMATEYDEQYDELMPSQKPTDK